MRIRSSSRRTVRRTGLVAALLAGTAPVAAGAADAPAPAVTTATLAVPLRPGSQTVGAVPAAGPGAVPIVQINTGRGRLITLSRPMTDLFISDEGIADVQVRSPTQLYVFGKKTGETTLSATNRAGRVVYATTVRVGQNYDAIGQMLTLAMPEARITATSMNGLVLLTGIVAAPADAAEAEKLVQAFVGDGTRVLSRLRTATPLQVNLQVRIAEVSRSFVKNIGVNLATTDSTGGFKFGIARGTNGGATFTPGGPLGVGFSSVPAGASRVPQGAASTIGLAPTRLLGLDILGSLDLGETIGQVTTLANPNLTVLSGETATFLAGGELPIPLSQGLGAVSVEFKQYGISLAYSPTVLADGRISLRVRPEVSQLSYDSAVSIGGTTVPGLTTRRVETTLELGSGQSMVIGGLLQNTHNNSIEKTPGLGNLPILGALFRSNGFRRSETELVVVITPYLVKPVSNPADIHLPTDGYKAPTDLERVFLGQLGTGTSGAGRPLPTAAPPADAGPPPAGVAAPVGPAAAVRLSEPKRRGPRAAAPGFSQ